MSREVTPEKEMSVVIMDGRFKDVHGVITALEDEETSGNSEFDTVPEDHVEIGLDPFAIGGYRTVLVALDDVYLFDELRLRC